MQPNLVFCCSYKTATTQTKDVTTGHLTQKLICFFYFLTDFLNDCVK